MIKDGISLGAALSGERPRRITVSLNSGSDSFFRFFFMEFPFVGQSDLSMGTLKMFPRTVDRSMVLGSLVHCADIL